MTDGYTCFHGDLLCVMASICKVLPVISPLHHTSSCVNHKVVATLLLEGMLWLHPDWAEGRLWFLPLLGGGDCGYTLPEVHVT